MFHVEGICPFCHGGSVGFRRCSDGKTIVLMCDECEAVWLDPEHRTAGDALFPHSGSFEVPGLGVSIGGDRAGWATRAEVESAGWQEHVFRDAPALDEILRS
jgi:hypothetical protein